MSDAITPYTIAIPDSALVDLRARLGNTRWPEPATAPGWTQGVPLEAAQALCAYWRDHYDWRRCEATLNGLGQHRTEIDGLNIHFLHIRSKEPGALPMVLTHGWPGSVVEFLKVIGPLTDPVAHGGAAADAFHLVIPSLPGYGFSDKPETSGWSAQRIARAWIVLMRRLGYERFVAQGGDWGSAVATAIAATGDPAVAGIHLNMVIALPTEADRQDLTDQEAKILADSAKFRAEGQGYSAEQSTKPQTLGYGLTDSPAGQAMWILEKLAAWSDCDGDPLNAFTYDEMLDNIMLYWLTASAASSARLYWESHAVFPAQPIQLPVGCSIFPKEIIRASRRWAERKYANLIHWGEPAKGGHFAAFEQPALFTEEVRAAFRTLR